jgi:transmembrane sensor
MPQEKEFYEDLLRRYLTNDCTPAEADELLRYLQQDDANRPLLREMKMQFDQELAAPTAVGGDWNGRIRQNLLQHSQPARVVPFYKKWLPRVAAVLLLGTATLFYLQRKPSVDVTQAVAKSSLKNNDIPPGGNKATLTLSDGSTIVLNDVKDGKLTTQGNTTVIKLNDRIAYQPASAGKGEVLYNTITTPRGGQYVLILPDESKVWLNSASSLRFPAAFTGATRNVTLTGEGYFEVAKNASMPFHVTVNRMDVEVLGTHFNIMAYENESAVRTTLLEGSVKLKGEKNEAVLHPGQQGIVAKEGGTVTVQDDVNTEQVTAWKNGFFQFSQKTDLETVLRQMERWYDIDVAYEGKIQKREFWGKLPMNVGASEALKILETSGVRFRLEGKKIIIVNP